MGAPSRRPISARTDDPRSGAVLFHTSEVAGISGIAYRYDEEPVDSAEKRAPVGGPRGHRSCRRIRLGTGQRPSRRVCGNSADLRRVRRTIRVAVRRSARSRSGRLSGAASHRSTYNSAQRQSVTALTAFITRPHGTSSKNFWTSRSITQSYFQHRCRHTAIAWWADTAFTPSSRVPLLLLSWAGTGGDVSEASALGARVRRAATASTGAPDWPTVYVHHKVTS